MENPTTVRKCSTCGSVKDLGLFHKNKADKKFGRETRCKECSIKRLHAFSKSYTKEERRDISYKHRLKNEYGLTVEQYEAMARKQKGVCKICEKPASDRLHVDHNHLTNEVRGLLCGNCNRGLGLFKENPEIINSAISYLKEFSHV